MVSPRKASSALNMIPEERKLFPLAKKSCESLCSQTSSQNSLQAIYQTKHIRGRQRQPSIIPGNSDIRQRVLSARRLRMKTYQNQLVEAQNTISELTHENRILRTLHKRQDMALAKYESTSAELPQLLHSHAEEVRVWQTKYRTLQTTNKELEQKVKQKEALILSLTDQNKYYMQLNKDKNLDDRQRLTDKLQQLEERLKEKDNELKIMSRKLQLEGKKFKQQLQLEQTKNKTILMKLDQARLELTGFRKLENLHLQEKFDMQVKKNKSTSILKEQPLLKPSMNAIKEEDSILNTETTETTETTEETEETEEAEEAEDALHTHRSQQSIVNVSHCTTTTVKKSNQSIIPQRIKMVKPPTASTTAILKEATGNIPNLSNQTKLPKGVLKHVDHGDGDASKHFNKANLKQPIKALSTLSHPKPEKVSTDYDDASSVNDTSEPIAPNSGDDTTDESSNNYLNRKNASTPKPNYTDENAGDDYSGVDNGTFMANIDCDINDDEIYEDEEDTARKDMFYDHIDDNELSMSDNQNRIKEEISTIRKKISYDYKERDAFLDTFCRQASNAKPERPITNNKKKSNKVKEVPTRNQRKDKLLAALKAIDHDKSPDS